MSSRHCLEYQARSRGESTSKKGFVSGGPNGAIEVWKQKYLPCLDCTIGKQVKAGQIGDQDVTELIETKHSETKNCPGCGPQPISNFHRNVHNKDGLQSYCKKCQAEKQAQSYQMKKQIDQALAISDKTLTRTCKRCNWTGPEESFHKAGASGYINVCRNCIVDKRRSNKEHRGNNFVNVGKQAVIIDFSNYPEIQESLIESARKNFRTVENEILFRVVNYVY
jgi:hypothetical protein